jgi:8-oxo-dGTP diphosphatase
VNASRYSKLRARACALVLKDHSLLLVKLHSPVLDKEIWIPPGGGINFGDSIFETATRECLEETNVKVNARRLCYVTELVRPPKIHALEYYIECDWLSGDAVLGYDPELNEAQILLDLAYIPLEELSQKADLYPTFLRTQLLDDLENDASFPKFITSK